MNILGETPILPTYNGETLCNYYRIGDERITKTDSGYQIIKGYSYNMVDIRGALHPSNTAHVKSYYPNDYGLYNMSGNVAEMILEKETAMGGSWLSPGYDVRIISEEKYEQPMAGIGFRVVLARKNIKP